MRTYKLTVAYDGTAYQGWQRQVNTDRTIQGILEKTISDQIGYEVEVNGSGRTDAGVHAWGQTTSVVLRGKVEEDFFTEKVNAKLPPDLRIREAELAKNGFHARKSAVWKVYQYQIDMAEKPDVFDRRYTYHFPKKLDLAAMQKAADLLTGTHEYAAYTDKKDEKSTKRTIYAIMVGGQGSRVNIQYEGTGFMYHMVRILTGTLLEVGIGARSVESVTDALQKRIEHRRDFLLRQEACF